MGRGRKGRSEKDRELTEAEKKRLANYEALRERLTEEGYSARELTVGIVKANVFALILAIPLLALTVFLFFVRNRASLDGELLRPETTIILVVMLLMLTVVHELLHGLTWGIYAKDHFKSIEFGFMKDYLTPYCTCTGPLEKGPYILGALMPLIVLGIIPAVSAIFSGSFWVLILGDLMILSAGGDILIVLKLLMYKSSASETLIIDHPTQAGSVIFEKQA